MLTCFCYQIILSENVVPLQCLVYLVLVLLFARAIQGGVPVEAEEAGAAVGTV